METLQNKVKNKGGRPRKPPTHIKSFRVNDEIKEFLDRLENANEFFMLKVRQSKEFQEFLKEKAEIEASQYNLFSEIERI